MRGLHREADPADLQGYLIRLRKAKEQDHTLSDLDEKISDYVLVELLTDPGDQLYTDRDTENIIFDEFDETIYLRKSYYDDFLDDLERQHCKAERYQEKQDRRTTQLADRLFERGYEDAEQAVHDTPDTDGDSILPDSWGQRLSQHLPEPEEQTSGERAQELYEDLQEEKPTALGGTAMGMILGGAGAISAGAMMEEPAIAGAGFASSFGFPALILALDSQYQGREYRLREEVNQEAMEDIRDASGFDIEVVGSLEADRRLEQVYRQRVEQRKEEMLAAHGLI